MLRPQDRRLFLESLRPPVDDAGTPYRLDLTIGTTYSLDLIAVLAAPVAMAFSDWQGRDGRAVSDPLALLKAVRQYADRICLFCQPGKIYVPKVYQPLLVNLETSIVQAVAPRGGSFHAKLWALRFQHPEQPHDVQYRVLCASRNLTFDRSWDTLLLLEGPLKQRTNAIARNHPLGEFIEDLPGMAGSTVSAVWQQRCRLIAKELRRVDFEVPAPFEDMTFCPLGIANHTSRPFPERIDRLLVVSPFIDDHGVQSLASPGVPLQVVSRPESLALLRPESLQACHQVWTLDDTAEPETGDAEQADAESSEGLESQQLPLLGLHAKLYVADTGSRASMWTGSANATQAAFERNVEFLIELSGKKAVCGVEAVLGKAAEAGPKKANCLADMLQPYLEHHVASAEQLAEIRFEQLVDRYSKRIIQAAPRIRCEKLSDAETFRLSVEADGFLPELPTGTGLRCWLLSIHESNGNTVLTDSNSWCRFEPISFDAITSFVAWELTSADEEHRRRFVLNLPLIDAPQHRRERVLQNLLNSPQKLMRFLLMLLIDQGAGSFGNILETFGADENKKAHTFEFLEGSLLESSLRALDREPTRIDQVQAVIHDLLQTADGRALLPDGFEEIWRPIWEVRQRQLVREQQHHSALAASSEPNPSDLSSETQQ